MKGGKENSKSIYERICCDESQIGNCGSINNCINPDQYRIHCIHNQISKTTSNRRKRREREW